MRATIFGLLLLGTIVIVDVNAAQTKEPAGKAPFLRVCAACHEDLTRHRITPVFADEEARWQGSVRASAATESPTQSDASGVVSFRDTST